MGGGEGREGGGNSYEFAVRRKGGSVKVLDLSSFVSSSELFFYDDDDDDDDEMVISLAFVGWGGEFFNKINGNGNDVCMYLPIR